MLDTLLNANILGINAYIKSKSQTYTTLLTNGTLLEQHRSLLNEVDHIIVSVDVAGSTNRSELSRIQALKNIYILPRAIKQKISIRCVVSRGEEERLHLLQEHAYSLGVDFIYVPRLPNNADDSIYLPEMDKINNDIIECSKEYCPTKCGAATAVVAVNWNGDIYPCQNLMGPEHYIASLNDLDWLDKLEQSSIRKIIKHANVLEIEKCRDCWLHFLCGGGCRALAHKVYGDINHPLDFFCDYFKRMAIKKLKAISFNSNTNKD